MNNKTAFLAIQFLKIFIGLFALVLCGTFMYMYIESWTFLDSLFMSVETLTTVGYGLFQPLSTAGKILTITYILFGVILFLYYAAQVAQYIVLLNFEGVFKRKNMESKLKNLKDHYILCGCGRTGKEVAAHLQQTDLKFIVIDKHPEFEEYAQEEGFLYLVGDATDDDILKKVGIERAKGIFCALSDDADNLYLTISAKDFNPEIQVIARCIRPSNEKKFLKAGATTAVLPYEISARRMVTSVTKPLIVDFLDVVLHTNNQELELKLEHVIVKEKGFLANKTIIESNLRDKSGITIVAIKRNGTLIPNPPADTTLTPNDDLIVLGTTMQLEKLEKLLK